MAPTHEPVPGERVTDTRIQSRSRSRINSLHSLHSLHSLQLPLAPLTAAASSEAPPDSSGASLLERLLLTVETQSQHGGLSMEERSMVQLPFIKVLQRSCPRHMKRRLCACVYTRTYVLVKRHEGGGTCSPQPTWNDIYMERVKEAGSGDR
uniref:Uncharacterized protein n=1 Tax=Knipowitschia caucasica TaxID=637954 RepID=A0AAV2JCW8_KNICA